MLEDLIFASEEEALQHLANITRKRIKIASDMKKHIEKLKALFPGHMIKSTKEFDGKSGGIWTDFAETGISDYYKMGGGKEHDPKLQKYMDDNNLVEEWYDAGTLMIYTK